MSSPTATKTEDRAIGKVMALMAEMGASSFTPIPPDQHDWQSGDAVRADVPPFLRLWSWLVHNTCFWGHRTPYAVDNTGKQLFLEHAAKDLKMDEANARKAWRHGLELGIWRNGTKEEGRRRMYLCGTVVAKDRADLPPDEGSEEVCTDLPDYLDTQVKDWSEERRNAFLTVYRRNTRVVKTLIADAMAAARSIGDRIEDNTLEEWGLARIRLNRKPKDEEAAEEERQRLERIAPLTPILERSVQTLLNSVQTIEIGLYKNGNGSVHSEISSASLLPEKSQKRPERACVDLGSTAAPVQPIPSNDGKESGYQPAVEKPAPAATDERKQAELQTVAKHLIEGIATLQKEQPRRFGGERVDFLNKGNRTWALNIVKKTGLTLDEVPDFLQMLEQRASRNALGHTLTPALISEIANRYPAAAADLARQREEIAAEAERARRAAAELEARNERDLQTYDQMEDRWQRMDNEERAKRLAVEEAKLKATPDWIKRWLHDKKARHAEMEGRAKSTLRREIEQSQVKAGGAA